MKRYSELLYWHGFSALIHGEEDEKGYYYMYDPGLPVRARKSFENWLRENDKKQFKNTMKHNYHSEDQPQTTYAEALEIASEIKEDIEVCIEFEKAFVFKAHDDVYQGGGYQFTSLVLMKDTAMIMRPIDVKQNGIDKGEQIATHTIQ